MQNDQLDLFCTKIGHFKLDRKDQETPAERSMVGYGDVRVHEGTMTSLKKQKCQRGSQWET